MRIFDFVTSYRHLKVKSNKVRKAGIWTNKYKATPLDMRTTKVIINTKIMRFLFKHYIIYVFSYASIHISTQAERIFKLLIMPFIYNNLSVFLILKCKIAFQKLNILLRRLLLFYILNFVSQQVKFFKLNFI